MALSLFLAAAAAIGVTDNPCLAPLPVSADWADLCRYHADNTRLKTLPKAERDIVFIGDSITAGWAAANPAFYRDGRINRGIGGQTTQQMLLRFPQDVLALKPRVVHIMAGTNDVAGNAGPTTLEAIEGNITAMVVLAKAAGIKVILASTPPASHFQWSPTLHPAPVIAALNERLRRLAARERVTFVDYGKALATPDGTLRPDFTVDGTHLNAAGYAAIEPSLSRALTAAR
ncbi:GDSL family lipase [Novosphingobium sp. G106]|uniref:GDSL-type esterase/lipase family protein n=1 Tax=Novosphingobium sp. G106 TaxID=2849500 RepID=UPI001C2CECCE|nr:GDSL-type esterase/lipase family protein [Novosphingobium sp. G106]MBV1691277.1 GDSL family lipase [Novosphingobium sp. G106]